MTGPRRVPQEVVLVRDEHLAEGVAEGVAALFAENPGWYRVTVDSKCVAAPVGATPELEDFWQVVAENRATRGWGDATVVFVTPKANESAWFAGVNPEASADSFIQVSDWEWVTPAPAAVPTAYALLVMLLAREFVERGHEYLAFFHPELRGCVADFCENKADLAIVLRTADICPSCLQRLEELGLADQQIRQVVAILDACREQATATARFRRETVRFSDWPHPLAATRHKAATVQAPAEKLRHLIDHLDCLVRYSVFWSASQQLGGPPERELIPLGHWVDALAGSADARLAEGGRIARETEVVLRRNDYVHGYAPLAEDAADEEVAQLEDALLRLERQLLPALRECSLVYVQSYSRQGAWSIEGTRMHGSNTFFETYKLKLRAGHSPEAVGFGDDRQLYLVDERAVRAYAMSPWVLWDRCSACEHRRLLLRESGIRTGSSKYIDVVAGHRENRGAVR